MINDFRLYKQNPSYLAHHGILGMKWGKRNGPPYPLGSSDHSASEKKDGWRKSLGGGRNEKLYRRHQVGGTTEFKRDTEKDQRGRTRKDSDTSLKTVQNVMTVIHAATFNPIGIYYDVKRYKAYSDGKKFVKENETRLASEFTKDKKTGFKLKNREMTEEEDMKYVNPEYNDWDMNTKQNCMLCTTAYELRRRGYEVQANKALFGYPHDAVKDWFPKAKKEVIVDPLKGKENFNDLDDASKKEVQLSLRNAAFGMNSHITTKTVDALKKQGNGARGNLIITLSNGGGHSVVYEIKNDNVIIRDCQSNKTYTDPSKLLNYTVGVSYFRLDNVDFDPKAIKEAVKG